MTDAACTISTVFSTDTRLGVTGSAGRIVPGIVAKAVKHDGTLAVFNEPGELQVRVKTPLDMGTVMMHDLSSSCFVLTISQRCLLHLLKLAHSPEFRNALPRADLNPSYLKQCQYRSKTQNEPLQECYSPHSFSRMKGSSFGTHSLQCVINDAVDIPIMDDIFFAHAAHC